ncbi:Neurotransmitter-gated ion-channel ligand binding domain protein [Ancylostoma duodenale]|uniref:Neurotransmitter-gated ion-channel ligand binding domain protein n=2 Tax=Ancylostoma TaxID=29169 RepID=A0A0C2DZF2_9BILA|nr:Neurotransmitter-gated ion-channel ligand binding domain protein [Ancylostoma duodenale]
MVFGAITSDGKMPLLFVPQGLNVNSNNYLEDVLKKPASGPHEPITIKLKLRLSQIIDVVWIDRKLAWDPKNYGGVSVLYVPYEMIWVPDIVLYNKFPFDEQQCHLKFGSWTYSENLLNLELLDDEVRYEKEINERGIVDNITIAEDGIDLSDYYPSVEWDIMSRVAIRRSKNYPSCCKQSAYVDITYYLNLRRKPLFYTVNLVFPCVGISFLTILVFYLPSHSGEKITLCISILVALTIFYLLLNYSTEPALPDPDDSHNAAMGAVEPFSLDGKIPLNYHEHRVSRDQAFDDRIQKLYYSPQVVKAFENIVFIAEMLKKNDRDDKIDEDWKYVAMVLDRLFLVIFSFACFIGTLVILLQAPTLYDYRKPIDLQYRPANLSAIL